MAKPKCHSLRDSSIVQTSLLLINADHIPVDWQGIARGKYTTYKVICFLYLREYTASNSNHPEELINVITWVANKP